MAVCMEVSVTSHSSYPFSHEYELSLVGHGSGKCSDRVWLDHIPLISFFGRVRVKSLVDVKMTDKDINQVVLFRADITYDQ